MTASVIIPMAPAHVPQIAELERVTFSAPWVEDAVRAELDNPLSLWLVAADGEDVLGYVGSQTVFEDTDILNVAVKPAARRRGIAETLMRALEQRLILHGAQRITLEVRISNAPALALYEKLGYVRVGLRRNYYEKPREDALILQKRLLCRTSDACPYKTEKENR